jgi:putative hydrolase of the HAD superfamily
MTTTTDGGLPDLAEPRPGSFDALVLDVGGVLLCDPIPRLFDAMAGGDDALFGRLKAMYDNTLTRTFWTGELGEDEFWSHLATVMGHDERSLWRRTIDDLLAPLPACTAVSRWSGRIPVVLLSNHRAEWVRPALARAIDMESLRAVFISSELGLAKPNLPMFQLMLETESFDAGRLIYVDDRDFNLVAASQLGMQPLWADPMSAWTATVDALLGKTTAP